MKKISSIGEFGFINRLAKKIPTDKTIIKGIGDDSAVLEYTRKKYMLVCSDMIIEGIHFNKKDSLRRVGGKALNVSLSDIGAMAGEPKYFTFSIGLKSGLSLRETDELVEGVLSAAKRFNVQLIGGDTNSSDKIVLETTVIGFVDRNICTFRSGSKVGDGIFVTGSLGKSILGHHLDFVPRIKYAGIIAKKLKPHSMIDISDGLVNDLDHIIRAGKIGAVLYGYNIPVRKTADLENALYDGEDFELLFTVGKEYIESAKKLAKGLDIKLSHIGYITDKTNKIELVDCNGKIRSLSLKGYRHF